MLKARDCVFLCMMLMYSRSRENIFRPLKSDFGKYLRLLMAGPRIFVLNQIRAIRTWGIVYCSVHFGQLFLLNFVKKKRDFFSIKVGFNIQITYKKRKLYYYCILV